jgi:hypothetical protein
MSVPARPEPLKPHAAKRFGLWVVNSDKGQEWVVFVICVLFMALGVMLSFIVFGTVLKGSRMVAGAFAIVVVMLGISYGTKAHREATRRSLTPLEVVHFTAQGFLWPGAWPALASVLGIQAIAGPH